MTEPKKGRKKQKHIAVKLEENISQKTQRKRQISENDFYETQAET